ncbi:YfaP family protein [Tautonia marina]|uniref:YfaP family protein n=1 Tax=Tautonia marina TaxID=2653855 RepID=UPI00126040B1|nr:hypothetical protein [Tautonia marina]
MTPEHREDAQRVDPLGSSPATDSIAATGPGNAPSSARSGTATAVASRAARLRRSITPLVRLKGRRTILDTPEEEAERKPLLETLLVGWTGSVIVHAALVALLVLLVILLPQEKPRVAFETEVGSSFGDEDGLDRIGGFDDELTLELDPTEITPEPLMPELITGLDVNRELVQTDPSRSEVGGSTGIGGGEFGTARFGEGLETIQGVEVKVGDPQFTLIWESAADLDLHVIEPGGSHIYWAQRQGKNAGELDVDDTDGFGPENIYWLDPDADGGEKIKGQGPSGVYHWYVHYYGPPGGFGGKVVPTRWKVRVKHAGEVSVFEGTLRRINQRSDVRSLRVGSTDDS